MRKRLLNRWIVAVSLPTLMLCLSPVVSAAEGKPAGKTYLGIGAAPTPPDAAHQGVLVRDVTPDSPAAKAGFKDGDVIVKVGDKDVKNFEGLADVVSHHKAGDKVTFHVFRDGKEHDLTATLGERRAEARRVPGPMNEFFGNRHEPFLGVQTQELNADLKDRLGLTTDKGALVTQVMPGTPAAKAGIKQDDVITAVNGKAVANPQELRDAVHKAGTEKETTVSILRGKEKMDVKARLEESPLAAFPGPSTWTNQFRGEMPSFFQPDQRVKELERRIEDLEKQVHDLQKKLDQSKK